MILIKNTQLLHNMITAIVALLVALQSRVVVRLAKHQSLPLIQLQYVGFSTNGFSLNKMIFFK